MITKGWRSDPGANDREGTEFFLIGCRFYHGCLARTFFLPKDQGSRADFFIYEIIMEEGREKVLRGSLLRF